MLPCGSASRSSNMVPRYARPQMTAIWSAENRYRIWFAIDIKAIDAIEAVTRHDVIAFLSWAGSKLGPEARWLHQGMTSSDVLDTALAVQLKQAADLLVADLDELLAVLKGRALEHK